MEFLKYVWERPVIRRALAVSVGIVTLEGCNACSWNDLNPQSSITHGAAADAGATREILHNYPGADDIRVTHADDNPNYMTWELEDGSICTAFASQTQNRGGTPGRLISTPYCREINGE